MIHSYALLLFSMFLNFIVVAYSINRPNAAIPVSLSGTSIIIQGLVMRIIAIT